MTFLMYCVDPKDHILKVLWHYLHFWLKYKHLKDQGYKQGYAQWVTDDILEVLVRPKDHVLKISWHYLHFWLKYKHLKHP